MRTTNQKSSETLDLSCTVYDNCKDYVGLFGANNARSQGRQRQRTSYPGHDSAFRNEAETVGALRREFAMCLARGVHVWWFDMFGGWFDSPSLMAEIKRMRKIGDRFAGTSSFRAEVAVLVDADSMYYVDGQSALARPVLAQQRSTLSRMGAPWEIYSLADLPGHDMSRFRMVVLPNLFAVTPQKRAWLDEKVFCDGKLVVELFSGRVVSQQPVMQFADKLPPLSTRLYHLTQSGQSIKAATR